MAAYPITNIINKKNLVLLLFFTLFAWVLVIATLNFHSFYDRGYRNTTYMYLAAVALFFIHNIVLLPIKLKENNSRKYLILCLISVMAFFLVEGFYLFDIINRMYSPNNIFGITPKHGLSLLSVFKAVVVICIPLLIVSLLTALYAVMVYGFRVISGYLEGFVHIFILTMLIALVIMEPRIIEGLTFNIAISLLFVFYINTFLITPAFLNDKKVLVFILGILTMIISYFLIQAVLLLATGAPKFDTETGNPVTGRHIPAYIFSAPAIILFIITLFISFMYGYVRYKVKTKENFLNIKLGEKESQLKLLKSQVNPHFLFNTLNTLYACALAEKAEKTSASIANLANLLRYMQKDINEDFIPLENEMKYINDYVAIQKLRCAIEPQVETQYKNIKNQWISPGLFIPFVENAFKYGIDPSKPSLLKISISCFKNEIAFSCVNSYSDGFKTFHKEKGFGIGIKNAKQRLELVYPKNHIFEIIKQHNKFSVNIRINTHKQKINLQP